MAFSQEPANRSRYRGIAFNSSDNNAKMSQACPVLLASATGMPVLGRVFSANRSEMNDPDWVWHLLWYAAKLVLCGGILATIMVWAFLMRFPGLGSWQHLGFFESLEVCLSAAVTSVVTPVIVLFALIFAFLEWRETFEKYQGLISACLACAIAVIVLVPATKVYLGTREETQSRLAAIIAVVIWIAGMVIGGFIVFVTRSPAGRR